jgi:hypothetical protein
VGRAAATAAGWAEAATAAGFSPKHSGALPPAPATAGLPPKPPGGASGAMHMDGHSVAARLPRDSDGLPRAGSDSDGGGTLGLPPPSPRDPASSGAAAGRSNQIIGPLATSCNAV